MSKTACWGTNRLDVDVANVYMGYGSCHDMIHHRHGFQVSLEALQAIVSFDYDYLCGIALDTYPSEGLTEYGYERLFSYGITMDMMYRTKNIFDSNRHVWPEKSKELTKEILKVIPIKAQYKLSPLSIVFKELNDKESEEKAVEWFEQLIPFINKNYQEPYIKLKDEEFGNVICQDGNYSYMYIGYTKPKELADIANRAIEIMDEANAHSTNTDKYTEMYLCVSDEDQKIRRCEYEKFREEQRKKYDDLKESLQFE